MSRIRIHHISLIITNSRQSEAFYQQILELKPVADRPDLGFPGIWYQVGDQQIHLLQVDETCASKNAAVHGGRDRHLALCVDNLDEITQRLSSRNIPYNRSKSGRKAVFFRDPDDNVLELIQI